MRRIHFASIRVLAAVVTLSIIMPLFATSSVAASKEANYVLGVFPYLPPRELEKVFSPMAADFANKINHSVQVRSSSSYKKFMGNLNKEAYDVVFVQPFDYVNIADKFGYRPLATRKELLSAIFVVAQDSKLEDNEQIMAQQLKGKTIALPPKVAAVSRLTLGYLDKHGIVPGKDVTITHHRSHMSCMQQVVIGRADICATAHAALRFFESKMKTSLKIVARTQHIPHSLFAIHPRVPEERAAQIRRTIVSWSKTPEGKAMLERGKFKPFRLIKDEEYDIVRQLRDVTTSE